ncbi:hypothetical protein GCM10023172_06670 [Hymenobacter ginsengisoli]|uniref:Uncharacterized protein n=1 Tax=Hymenobacter ginsengisoli TaxID=1051626 RepID=A0ABP8PZH2_9BACT
MLYQYWQQRAQVLQEPFYANHLGKALATVAADNAETAGMLFLGAFSIALMGSALRYPFLAAAIRKTRTRRSLTARFLLVFLLQVAALAIPPWPIAYNQFGLESISRQLVVLFLLNLPWLVATGLATRRLAAALQLLPTVPSAASATSG